MWQIRDKLHVQAVPCKVLIRVSTLVEGAVLLLNTTCVEPCTGWWRSLAYCMWAVKLEQSSFRACLTVAVLSAGQYVPVKVDPPAGATAAAELRQQVTLRLPAGCRPGAVLLEVVRGGFVSNPRPVLVLDSAASVADFKRLEAARPAGANLPGSCSGLLCQSGLPCMCWRVAALRGVRTEGDMLQHRGKAMYRAVRAAWCGLEPNSPDSPSLGYPPTPPTLGCPKSFAARCKPGRGGAGSGARAGAQKCGRSRGCLLAGACAALCCTGPGCRCRHRAPAAAALP